jgi:succinate dehydrogenase/fumarate reductase-like Fe-S protein
MEQPPLASAQSTTLLILRCDPATGSESAFQEYHVPFRDGFTVMDALLYIYENLDPSLAFRASCQTGLCMACLIQIDGRGECPCKTYLRSPIQLEPLKHKKVIRDLVVETD